MRIADFHFELPPDLIAQHPAPRRDGSRLLVLNRADASIQHLSFCDLPPLLDPRDVLVLNQTRVIPARLQGRSPGLSGVVELLVIRQEGERWLALGKPAKRLGRGCRVEFGEGQLRAEVLDAAGPGRVWVRFEPPQVWQLLPALGQIPLPPYIRRQPGEEDRERYQTVFARVEGAVAAPTAGLHFTPQLLERITAQGTALAPVLLHVGPGTFAPVRVEDPALHKLEAEYYQIGEESAALLRQRRQAGGRIVAVGTTVVRTLETVCEATGEPAAGEGWTAKYIYPPYTFRGVDALLTNFHLPGSTLLLLVAAFAGRELMLAAYRQAVAAGYRFYSYGDAMLIR
ncbi:MAG: tRNA preQ1(34) S-adenosylmethionine ribosyltransferase-isomerase QueA [Candidatus Handelsmanbacteria bacterium]|nr:tRNA preQ1(34) S-adenosylmethionine ribosyltransferase-isomerase QueA [Candidatus Handelsmanbacteria bacterium]